MKKRIRILAIVLAAAMLLCCCSFGINISYDCQCTSTQSSASSYCSVPGYISASFSGTVTKSNGEEFDVSGSSSYNSNTSADCFRVYSSAASGYIYSNHTINGRSYSDSSSF